MKLSGELKFIFGIVIVSAIIIGVAVLLLSSPAQGLSRSDLLPKGTNTLGNQDSKVYLVEFSDFQCPACKAYKPVVDKILKKNQEQIVFGYRHFPLPQHPFGYKAALVSEIAAAEGKFWQMYEYLFENQDQFSEEFIKQSGKAIGMDEKKFQQALDNKEYEAKIAKDISDGSKLGINSTPTFFLNGEKLLLQTPTDLEKAIEEVLKR